MASLDIKKSIYYEVSKRIIDIIFCTILIILFFPLIICIAAAIMIDSPGPIFADTPARIGKDGKLFKMFKFRSMVPNAHELLREDPEFAKLFEAYKKGSYKLKNDPRITRVGSFIRKHSLDEVPQFFNVLLGQMSLV
ncbi:MAG TPA: sugar transferase, partial [Candidatus Saccharimonadales bacterium]|nr:sugar transferase [Candidatus Saccharimonadales bacterium]